MEYSVIQGLPEIVYQLLKRKCEDEDYDLIWNIGGHGQQTELSLKWLPKGSQWEDPFVPPVTCAPKHKSPGCIRRDINRKKWFNVDKNSVAVNTEDTEDNNLGENVFVQTFNDTPSSTHVQTSGEEQQQSAVTTEASQTSQVSHDQTGDTKTDPSDKCEPIVATDDLNKETYTFNLFKKGANNPIHSVITALSIDNRYYQYHYEPARSEPRCVLLERFGVETSAAAILFNLCEDILPSKTPPLHDYFISLHEFAKNDFV